MTDFLNPTAIETPAPAGETKQGESKPAGDQGQDQGFLEYNGRKLSKEEVAKKLANADSFIEQLKAERENDRRQMSSIEELLKKAVNAETLLGKLKPESSNPANPAQAATPALDEDAIVTKAAERILKQQQEASAKQREAANWNTVTAELTKRYGAKVNERVAEVAAQNEMSLDEAVSLARSKPSVFLKLFPSKPAPQPNVSSSRNPLAALKPSATPSVEASALFKANNTNARVAAYTAKLQAALASQS